MLKKTWTCENKLLKLMENKFYESMFFGEDVQFQRYVVVMKS